MKPLDRLWAVTSPREHTVSLYEITWAEDGVTATKLQLAGESNFEPGSFFSTDHLLVGNSLIELCIPDFPKDRRKLFSLTGHEVTSSQFGRHTSPLLGLFLLKESAEKCFRIGSEKPIAEYEEEEWFFETGLAIRSMGICHPGLILVSEGDYQPPGSAEIIAELSTTGS